MEFPRENVTSMVRETDKLSLALFVELDGVLTTAGRLTRRTRYFGKLPRFMPSLEQPGNEALNIFGKAYLRTYPVQAAEIDGRRRSFRTPGTSCAARCVHLAAFSRRVLIYGLGSGRKATGERKRDECSGGSGWKKEEK